MKTNKKLILTLTLSLLLIVLSKTTVLANYQSSPNAGGTTKDIPDWMSSVRTMEADGQVMGLNETIDSSTLFSNETNNIDVHVQKSTEYGAVAILAVSDYGKQGNGTEQSDWINNTKYGLATTTGNKFGIYRFGTNWEMVAAGLEKGFSDIGFTTSNTTSIFNKYANLYTTTQSGKRGDAMLETNGWQSAAECWVAFKYPFFVRGGGSSFGYSNTRYWKWTLFPCGCGLSVKAFNYLLLLNITT